MSVEEMIASLQSQKIDCVQRFDQAIQDLQKLLDLPSPEQARLQAPSRFRPLPSTGRPASEIILEARGRR